jgi:hypothetical protein
MPSVTARAGFAKKPANQVKPALDLAFAVRCLKSVNRRWPQINADESL